MFTDTAALGVALFAIRIAKRVADRQRTFGAYELPRTDAYELCARPIDGVQ